MSSGECAMPPIAESLRRTLNAVWALGGEVQELVVEDPATDEEVASVEAKVGTAFPREFRDALTGMSGRLLFSWRLPREVRLPAGLEEIFAGQLEWGLDLIPQLEDRKRPWVTESFSNPDDPYDRVWHDKLAFQAVPNGDYLALDLSQEGWGRVVCLSHDDGEGHGYVLGRDFLDFLNRWVPLGCPGPEDWQWLPFTKSKDSGIDPECVNAKRWLSFLYGDQ
jgi:hypothetical protein